MVVLKGKQSVVIILIAPIIGSVEECREVVAPIQQKTKKDGKTHK